MAGGVPRDGFPAARPPPVRRLPLALSAPPQRLPLPHSALLECRTVEPMENAYTSRLPPKNRPFFQISAPAAPSPHAPLISITTINYWPFVPIGLASSLPAKLPAKARTDLSRPNPKSKITNPESPAPPSKNSLRLNLVPLSVFRRKTPQQPYRKASAGTLALHATERARGVAVSAQRCERTTLRRSGG
jgi:hypothetical protein